MPLYDCSKGGKLVALAKFLNGGFQHPVHAMVVNKNDFTEAIIPQPKHYVDQRIYQSGLIDDYRTGHANVMVGVTTIVEGREGQRHLVPTLCCVTADSLTDRGAHKCIQAGIVMDTVIFGAAQGHKHHVIFMPLFNDGLSGQCRLVNS